MHPNFRTQLFHLFSTLDTCLVSMSVLQSQIGLSCNGGVHLIPVQTSPKSIICRIPVFLYNNENPTNIPPTYTIYFTHFSIVQRALEFVKATPSDHLDGPQERLASHELRYRKLTGNARLPGRVKSTGRKSVRGYRNTTERNTLRLRRRPNRLN